MDEDYYDIDNVLKRVSKMPRAAPEEKESDWKKITREEFASYVDYVRNSYLLSVREISLATGLDRPKVLAIQNHYISLKKKYPGVLMEEEPQRQRRARAGY